MSELRIGQVLFKRINNTWALMDLKDDTQVHRPLSGVEEALVIKAIEREARIKELEKTDKDRAQTMARNALKICQQQEQIKELESQRRTLQRCLETLLYGDFATDPEQDDMRRRLITSALSCLKRGAAMSDKQYGHDDARDYEPYFSRHLMAMTTEDLHGKGEIACELAYRDTRIKELKAENHRLRNELVSLGYGREELAAVLGGGE